MSGAARPAALAACCTGGMMGWPDASRPAAARGIGGVGTGKRPSLPFLAAPGAESWLRESAAVGSIDAGAARLAADGRVLTLGPPRRFSPREGSGREAVILHRAEGLAEGSDTEITDVSVGEWVMLSEAPRRFGSIGARAVLAAAQWLQEAGEKSHCRARNQPCCVVVNDSARGQNITVKISNLQPDSLWTIEEKAWGESATELWKKLGSGELEADGFRDAFAECRELIPVQAWRWLQGEPRMRVLVYGSVRHAWRLEWNDNDARDRVMESPSTGSGQRRVWLDVRVRQRVPTSEAPQAPAAASESEAVRVPPDMQPIERDTDKAERECEEWLLKEFRAQATWQPGEHPPKAEMKAQALKTWKPDLRDDAFERAWRRATNGEFKYRSKRGRKPRAHK